MNTGLPLRLARLHRAGAVGTVAEIPAGTPPALLEGAGLDPTTGARLRTLPDIVGPGMRMLVCGLNPSLYAADAGVHYGRPGNRFWPAALDAGVVSRDRDPWHALRVDRVGWTDIVKRATVAAAELRAEEYTAGMERVRLLVGWLRPRVVCFVGLTGWRAAIDRRAVAGFQPDGLADVRAYVMPNTSGLNARSQHDDFVAHLVAAMGSPARSSAGC
ncbi:MAG: mismatch-specific DNA-glycosylase [Acidimicrobiales bacterium]